MTASLLALFVLLFILIFYARFFFCLNKEPVYSCGDSFVFSRKDILLLLSILVIYGFSAFFRLGNSYAPDNDVHFQTDDKIFFSIEDGAEAASFQAYTGLNTGRYLLKAYDAVSREYVEIGELTQEYSKLFQWNEFYLYFDSLKGYSRFSVTALSDLYLNELVILDSGGNPLTPVLQDSRSETVGLFDEQEKFTDNDFMSGSYFDEIYHARTALEHIKGVDPYEITHPPLGKLIISLGIRIFGMNPFGWRFSGTLFGILMLIPFYVLTKRLYGDTRVSCCTTVLFAFDFMHFTQTRLATIDTYSVFFILLMYLFMYLYISSERKKYLWLGLCGFSFGLGCACKWTSLYAGCGLALLWLLEFIGQIRDRRNYEKHLSEYIKNILFCLGFFIIIPALIYYLSYVPYGKAADLSGVKMLFNRDYFRIVADNQKYMFQYHSNIVAEHPYSSKWYEWMLDIFPMLYYLKVFPDGTRSLIGCLVNPLLCWAGLIAVFHAVLKLMFEKDEKSGFVVIAYLSQLVPWMFIERLTFEYHYFPSSVFLILSLSPIFRELRRRLKHGTAYILVFTLFSVILFLLFYPVLSGSPISESYSRVLLRWLPKWYL